MSQKMSTFEETNEGMTPAEERAQQALICSRDEEKRRRIAAEKQLQEKDARLSEKDKQLAGLQAQMHEMNGSIKQLTQILIGNGDVSISSQVRDAIVSSLREEFTKREAALTAAFEKRLEEAEMENNRLKGLLKTKGRDNDSNNLPGGNASTMTPGQIDALKQQKKNLATILFGQKTETDKFHHGQQQTEDADTLDLDGQDVPAETVKVIAEGIKAKSGSRKGISTPRRPQPLKDLAECNKEVVKPEGLPADARLLGSEKRFRAIYVKGHTRMVCIELTRYIGSDGTIYEAKLPKEYKNCMGRTEATEA